MYNTCFMVKDRLDRVRERLAAAARAVGRNPEEVRLICVTKGVPPEQIQEALACGVTEIGENRVQVAQAKQSLIGRGIRWHLVGHLQRNKARSAVGLFDWIHSVDRLELAQALDRASEERRAPVEVLVQVNAAGIPTRFGISIEETPALVERLVKLSHLRVRGLMTMAPFSENPEDARPIFRQVARLARELSLKELSMGMSQDFETAVQEGATMVRIGTAIFGE